MGLDMNLYRKTYINDEHIKISKNTSNIKPKRIRYIVEEIGYWRKANMIHNWIIKNKELEDEYTNGVDIPLSIADLKELLDVCKTVIKNSKLVEGLVKNGYKYANGEKEPLLEHGKYIIDPTTAKELLPCTEGFFFGSQEYDQYYYNDVLDTINIIKEALEDSDDYTEFIYNANW